MMTLKPSALAPLANFDHALGRAVGRDDAGFVGDLEGVEGFGGALHGRPVGLAAHDDGDRRRGRHKLGPPWLESARVAESGSG